ncbi:hypothetical protein BKA83DRAFT_4246003 [Pisolithus microcarpus]|nr:hypothetical protein BKA83DRAFT_4246003 [Pisolithus microcarpus]
MDELDEARAELARLEGTERTIFKQLVEIRVAIKKQKSTIEELIKKRPPVINRLPVELLSWIFRFLLVHNDSFTSTEPLGPAKHRKGLSMVSRLWRNVILDTPEFWSDIVLTDDQPPDIAFLEIQLRRSRKVPLNITITGRADRWQRLHVFKVRYSILYDILRALESMEFPSLKEIHMDMQGEFTHSLDRLPFQAPALRKLKLLDFIFPRGFATAATLTTLELTLGRRLSGAPAPQIEFPAHFPTHSLTVLSLTKYASGWLFQRDSIHLPLLDVLALAANDPERVMKAIVAPKLAHFGFSTPPMDHHISFGTGSKFNHVQTFNCIDPDTYQRIDGDTLCQEFRGTIDLRVAPADHCTSLEHITIFGLDFHSKKFDPLVRWLTKRRALGRPRISPVDGTTLLDFTLKVDYVEMCPMVNHSTREGVFQLDLLGVESVITDYMFLDTFKGNAQRTGCLPGYFRFYKNGTP